MFSVMDISRQRPVWRRSSGTRPIPAEIASRGDRIDTGTCLIRISPVSGWRRPKRVRTSADRPAPTSPAIPTISPLRTLRDVMECRRPRQGLHLESQLTRLLRRPVHLAQLSADHEPDDLVLIRCFDLQRARVCPSRRTVTRSQSWNTSCRRCVIRITARPSSRSLRSRRNRSSTSSPVSDAVGSSRAISDGRVAATFAISTSCR